VPTVTDGAVLPRPSDVTVNIRLTADGGLIDALRMFMEMLRPGAGQQASPGDPPAEAPEGLPAQAEADALAVSSESAEVEAPAPPAPAELRTARPASSSGRRWTEAAIGVLDKEWPAGTDVALIRGMLVGHMTDVPSAKEIGIKAAGRGLKRPKRPEPVPKTAAAAPPVARDAGRTDAGPGPVARGVEIAPADARPVPPARPPQSGTLMTRSAAEKWARDRQWPGADLEDWLAEKCKALGMTPIRIVP
jgi:hypothetical protein